MPEESVKLENERGERLGGRLSRPPSAEPWGGAVFAHCFSCSKDIKAARRVAEGLAERGLSVLRFDFAGLGESEGEFGRHGVAANASDIEAAAAWLATHERAPGLLVGHSLGGSAALVAAGRIASVRAVATIGAPAEPLHVTELFPAAVEKIDAEGEAVVSIAGRSFTLTRSFLEDLRTTDVEARLAALGKALLLFHSPGDRIVPVTHARRIYDAASHPKSFVALDGADHLLSQERDTRFVAEVLAAWATRYLGAERA